MKIAVFGTGNVGSVLGKRLSENGHEVIFGSREPGSPKIQEWTEKTAHSLKADSHQKALDEAEAVVLAVPYSAVHDLLKSLQGWEGKIVIDCTNPLKNDLAGLEIGHTTSAAEEIQKTLKGAKVVKAFNSVGSKVMEDPVFRGEKSSMFVCGDDERAKSAVIGLAEELGFEVFDAGELSSARYLEQLAMLWIHLAFSRKMGMDFSMKVVRR